MTDTATSTLVRQRGVLVVGMWSAWATFALSIAYAAAVVAAGAARGRLEDPYWAIAEILVIVMAPILVTLMAAIHDYAPRRVKTFSLIALGWVLVTAGLTVTVHLVQLTVARRIDLAANPGLSIVFDYRWFEWPSLLYAVELIAWNFFFALALLFAAVAFTGPGRETTIRIGLTVSGLLTLAGLIGPVVGNLNWRLLGVFGYGLIFPLVCLMIGGVFRQAASAPDFGRQPEML